MNRTAGYVEKYRHRQMKQLETCLLDRFTTSKSCCRNQFRQYAKKLTKDAQAIIKGDYDHLAKRCQNGGVIKIPTSPLVTVAMNENDHRVQRFLTIVVMSYKANNG